MVLLTREYRMFAYDNCVKINESLKKIGVYFGATSTFIKISLFPPNRTLG